MSDFPSFSTEGEVIRGDCDAERASLLLDIPASSPPEMFFIDDEEKANWLVRKVVELRAYRERVDAWAAREKARANHDEQFLMMRFGPHLQAWATKQISKLKGRRRSICLPGGSVGFRKVGPVIVIEDENALITWAATSCPNVLVTTVKVSKSALNEYVDQTGEVPPVGVRVEPQTDRFYVA